MTMPEVDRALRELRWHRVSTALVNTRASEKKKAHPFTVAESILKGVAEACGGVPAGASVFFHLPGRRHSGELRRGDRLLMEVLFCSAGQDWMSLWRRAFRAHFGDGGSGRNFELAELGEVEARSYEGVAAELPELPAEGELCLEFLSPVPFTPQAGKPRTHLGAEALVELFQRRLALLFGATVPYQPDGDDVTVLPYYWDYTEIHHPSRSQRGQTQRIKGCAGKLYLKGRFGNLRPFLVLGSELHAGTKRSNSQGYYRLHPVPVPCFEPVFPNRWALASATRDVLQRYDDAAARLCEGPGEAFDEEAFAARLERELRSGGYTPSPHVAFAIRKKSGEERLVEQLQPRDLVVAQYLLKLLGPCFDRMFEECSIGFRKGMSRKRAVTLVEQALRAGCRYVVESDIEDFFPSVELAQLGALLDHYLPGADRRLRGTLHKMVHNGYVLNGSLRARACGLAQGSPLSPMLANLYLDAFDEALQGAGLRLIRYGDDFVVLTRTREEAEAVLAQSGECLARLGLRLNAEKTAVRSVEEGFDFLGIRFQGAEARLESEEEVARHRKPLYVTEPYLFLALSNDAIEVRRKGALVESIPLRRVSEVMVLGKAVFSTALLARCTAKNIPFTVASGTGYTMTTIRPDSKRYYDVAFHHAARHHLLSDTERLVIAKEFAAGKILNYKPFFRQRYKSGTGAFLHELDDLAAAVREAGDVDQVRGHEGLAARRVYEEVNALIVDPAFHLVRRQRSNPDRINALLNFGYYLLFTQVNATVRAVGLNPYLGFLHSEANNYESLACDIEELFRSRVDRLIVRLLNLKALGKDDFTENERGFHVAGAASRKFILQFQAEMARKEASNRLTLEESLYAQVDVFRRWAMDGRTLSFYEWRK